MKSLALLFLLVSLSLKASYFELNLKGDELKITGSIQLQNNSQLFANRIVFSPNTQIITN
jgi:hypothetical protein